MCRERNQCSALRCWPDADAGGGAPAPLLQVREIRLVRREGRSSVCLVLLRFASQLCADDFYRDFNGKAVSSSQRR